MNSISHACRTWPPRMGFATVAEVPTLKACNLRVIGTRTVSMW